MAPSLLESHSAPSNGTNGAATQYPRSGNVTLTPGFYVPTVAFFDPVTEDVDLAATRQHALLLAAAKVTGIVTHGSNGEAVHLSHSERQAINAATRAALDSVSRADMPLIVGCGAQSTRETIELCTEAAASGGNFALVLPPAYYGGLLTPALIQAHFRAVADASPIPLLIYNYPGACSGLDLDSDAIVALSRHPNIAGVKLTCGNTGKLARIAAAAQAPFLTMGGSVDFMMQTMVIGGHGTIGGLGNVAPKACGEVLRLLSAGKVEQARKVQEVVARGDWVAIKGGFVAVKVALQHYYDYGGLPRKPCALPEDKVVAKINSDLSELMELERSL